MQQASPKASTTTRLSSLMASPKFRQEQASTVGEIARQMDRRRQAHVTVRGQSGPLDSGPLSKLQLLLTLTDTCFFPIHNNLCPPPYDSHSSTFHLAEPVFALPFIVWPYPRHEPQHHPRQQQRACPECAASSTCQDHLSHASRSPICLPAA